MIFNYTILDENDNEQVIEFEPSIQEMIEFFSRLLYTKLPENLQQKLSIVDCESIITVLSHDGIYNSQLCEEYKDMMKDYFEDKLKIQVENTKNAVNYDYEAELKQKLAMYEEQ